MGDSLEKGLNRDEKLIYGEKPHRPLRDGLSYLGHILYGVFVPGSLLNEHKKSPHLHEDMSNLYCAWAGEIFRGITYLAGIAKVSHMFYEFYN